MVCQERGTLMLVVLAAAQIAAGKRRNVVKQAVAALVCASVQAVCPPVLAAVP